MLKKNAFYVNLVRREFLKSLLIAGSFSFGGVTALVRQVMAMGVLGYPVGIQKLKGEVFINRVAAKKGQTVAFGDTVTTGIDSMVIFVVENSVYLLWDNTEFEMHAETSSKYKKSVKIILKLLRGKALSVFSTKNQKRVITPTAVAGIRGSGLYVEAEPQKTYLCMCYGIADIAVRDKPDIQESFKTTHHDSPRYIYGSESGNRIEKAPVFNHTDAELIMLEALVFRKPPFVESDESEGGVSGGRGGY